MTAEAVSTLATEAVSTEAEDEPALRIGDVARLVGVSPSTLRAWERAGLVAPTRGEGRHRRYSHADVARLRRARTLREHGYGHRALLRVLSNEAPVDGEPVGAKLRALRTRRGLSLRRAATAAGVSIAYLSLIERGQATPTVALLQRVAAAYGGTLLEFFDQGESDEGHKLVRAGERRRLRGFDRVQMEDLVRFPNAALQVEIFTVEPGGGSGGGYAHEGEEAVFVLEGQLQMWLDESECYNLESGDTLYFRGTQTHRWHNPGATPTRLFWVNTPPTL